MAGCSTISGQILAFGALIVALAACGALALGCSPRNGAADATGAADVGSDIGVDVAGDGLDSVEVSPIEVGDGQSADGGDVVETELVDSFDVGDAITDVVDAITDAVDAITDSIGDGGDVDLDVGLSDLGPPEDATALDAGVPCTSTDIPAALTGTVEFEAAAYISNPVVMGCGKGPPKPVKTGTPCCDCPPPYSCYCNGECGWLRAPDLVKPQHDGQAVWTGKWVVSLGEAYGKYLKPFTTTTMPGDMNLQKWQPGSGKGFELVKLPSPEFPAGHAVLYVLGEKVVVAVRYYASGEVAYTPENPIYLYDPETNVFTKIDMPYCGKLLLSGGTLVCVAAGKSWVQGSNPGILVYDAPAGKWNLAQPPPDLVPKEWFIISPKNSVADGDAIYLVRLVRSYGPWPDGSMEYPGPGHILKYELKTQKWSDIGLVPESLQSGADWYVRSIDHVGVVLLKGTIQAARFRLDTFKWEVGPAILYSWQYGQQEPVLTPCGLLFGSGNLGGELGGGMSYRPVLLAADLSWHLLAPWGYPDDAVTSRKVPNVVLTDKELVALGGMNGPPQGNFVYHKDSYRYPLSALCNKGAVK